MAIISVRRVYYNTLYWYREAILSIMFNVYIIQKVNCELKLTKSY